MKIQRLRNDFKGEKYVQILSYIEHELLLDAHIHMPAVFLSIEQNIDLTKNF